MSLSKVLKGCCQRSGCLVWKGGTGGGQVMNNSYPYVWDSARKRTVNGRRYVWEQTAKLKIPEDHRIVMSCGNRLCLEFGHMKMMTRQDAIAFAAAAGAWKTVRKAVANAANGRKASKIGSIERADDLRALVLSGAKTAAEAAAEFNVSRRLVHKIVQRSMWSRRLAPNASVFNQVA